MFANVNGYTAYHRIRIFCQLQKGGLSNHLIDTVSLLTDELFAQLLQCVPYPQYCHGYRHLITFDSFICRIRPDENISWLLQTSN